MFGFLALVLLFAGLTATAVYGTASGLLPKKTPTAVKLGVELISATLASILLGAGTLFLFLWTGIYV